MEQLDPVPPRRLVPRHRPPVPQGRRLLRLQAAIPYVHCGLDAGHLDRDAGRLGGVPLLQRRDPTPARHTPRATAREGAHLGAAGPDRPGQGGRVRPAALVVGELPGRLRQRSRVHRRARPPAGGDAAHLRVDLRRRDPALQHPAPGLDPPRAGHRDLGLRGAGRGDHLSRAAAGAQGHAGAELARGAVHPTQHHGDPGGLRAEQRPDPQFPSQPDHHRQPDRAGRHPPSTTSGSGTRTPPFRCRRSSASRRSRATTPSPRSAWIATRRAGEDDAGAHRRTRHLVGQPGLALLGEHAPAVHPRQRGRRGAGQPEQHEQSRLRRLRRAACLFQRDPGHHATQRLLRAG